MGTEKQLKAFKQLFAHTVTAIKNKKLSDAIEEGKDKIIQLEKITEKEAEILANYLRRDLKELGCFLTNTEKTVLDWLFFDWHLLESTILDYLEEVADKTQLEYLELEHYLQKDLYYRVSDITSGGTFLCVKCQNAIKLKKASHIPTCTQCGGEEFIRAC